MKLLIDIKECSYNFLKKFDFSEIGKGNVFFNFLMSIQQGEIQEETRNLNEDYSKVDQFVCQKCKIELQDWHRVERDEDDEDVTFHEYEFKFCPNCGKHINCDDPSDGEII